MPDPKMVERVRALMARAADPGATEEEQRSSAHIAAKLCRDHGITIGEASAQRGEEEQGVTRVRAEAVVNGVRTVVETISTGRAGLDSALGFDVFGFAQELLRDRAKEAITSAIGKPKKPARRKRSR